MDNFFSTQGQPPSQMLGSQSNNLENLATSFLMANRNTGPQPIETANVGGHNLLVNRDNFSQGMGSLQQSLQGLATNFLMMKQMQKKNDFRKQVAEIMSSSTPLEDVQDDAGKTSQGKLGKMYQLVLSNPEIAKEMGILEPIVAQYEKQSNKETQGWKPSTKEEAIEVRSAGRINTPSASLQKVKEARTEKLITMIEDYNNMRNNIADAEVAVTRITQGLGGKLKKGYLKRLSPNDPMLGDWQKIKIVLTDAQLLNTAKTKGTISDKEMELFASAAANDDLSSLPAMKVVFNRLINTLKAEETGAVKTFKKLYNEDPYSWEGVQSNMNDVRTPRTEIPFSNGGVNTVPKYNSKTQKLQMNKKTGEYRVMPR